MPGAACERLVVAPGLCASQHGRAHPRCHTWSSLHRSNTGSSTGTATQGQATSPRGPPWSQWGKNATNFRRASSRAAQKGFTSPLLPLSWQVPTALTSQGPEGAPPACL